MIEPVWVTEQDALEIHEYVLSLDGGASGIRDANLLHSALARPQQYFAYAPSPDLIEMAAKLTAGVVKNHPFLDGNKRTGFLLGLVFLECNGVGFTAPEDEATRAVLALAAGESGEPEYAAFLRRWTTAPSAPAQTPSPGA
jgi:death-on-curing protein